MNENRLNLNKWQLFVLPVTCLFLLSSDLQAKDELSAKSIVEELMKNLALSGDVNNDGSVNRADLVLAAKTAKLEDLTAVLTNFGATTPVKSPEELEAEIVSVLKEILVDLGIADRDREGAISVADVDVSLLYDIEALLNEEIAQGSFQAFAPGRSTIDLSTADIRRVNTCQGPTRAWGMAFPTGYVNSLDENLVPKLERVCLTHLGEYDSETGARTADNYSPVAGGFYLNGKFLESRPFISSGLFVELDDPNVPGLVSDENDFRGSYLPTPAPEGMTALERHWLHQWAGELNMYHHVTRFRREFLNDSFVHSLVMPQELKQNIINRQFRPDYSDEGEFMVQSKPIIGPWGGPILSAFQGAQDYLDNTMTVLHRGVAGGLDKLAVGMAYDPTMIVGEYGSLVYQWLLNSPQPLEPGNTCNGNAWPTSLTDCMEDATNLVLGAWYSGNPETYRDRAYAARQWCLTTPGANCDPENFAIACEYPDVPGNGVMPCDRGQNVDNVMMFVESQQNYAPGEAPPVIMAIPGIYTYPFSQTGAGGSGIAYPTSNEKTALFFSALFYDFAHEVGIGWRNMARLWMQKLHMITNPQTNMRQYGATIMAAANELWPEADFPVLHEALFQAITSRGIPLNGATYFRDNLPEVIGGPENFVPTPFNPFNSYWSGRKFGSYHPQSQARIVDGQQSATYFSGHNFFIANSYTELEDDYSYMAYSLYKHSKLGPADSLVMSDGTFGTDPQQSELFSEYLEDGSYLIELEGRQLGNTTLLIPMTEANSRTINYGVRMKHCADQEECSRFEDNNPFGWRVIQGVKNGFSFTAEALSGEALSGSIYRLRIEDPSLTMTGPRTGQAQYTWEVLDQKGNPLSGSVGTETVGGQTIEGYSYTVSLPSDQPIKIRVTRQRAGYAPDTIEKMERANDLSRDMGNGAGRALVRNCLEVDPQSQLCL